MAVFAAAQPPEPDRAKVWQPMSSAPRDRLILLKSAIAGGNWPMVGKWNPVHGMFTTPNVLGLNQCQLYASAWADIPKYDDSPYYNNEGNAA